MKQREFRKLGPTARSYHNMVYNKKKLPICKSWESYDNFVKDMGERPSKDYHLYRKNPFKGYSKKNCLWKRFAREIRKIMKLSKDETEKLIKEHSAFIQSRINRYNGGNREFNEDLFQEGVVGILKAVEAFDDSYGVGFLTYAKWWIDAYILDFLKKERKYGESTVSNQDYLEAQEDTSFLVEEMETKVLYNQLLTKLEKSINKLPQRSKEIIKERYSGNGGVSLQDLGNLYNISRERVRQLEQKALENIKLDLKRRKNHDSKD